MEVGGRAPESRRLGVEAIVGPPGAGAQFARAGRCMVMFGSEIAGS